MIDIGPMPSPGSAGTTARPAHLTERHVLALGLVFTGVFVAGAMVAALAVVAGGGGSWAALHLALAGGATVAIGTFMPHFAVTLAGTRPAPSTERLAALVALAIGGLAVVAGFAFAARVVVAIGTALVLLGLAAVARHSFAPLRDPLARRHIIVAAAYGVALAELAAGVLLGGLGAVGLAPITAAWALLRPAHAWLALFGAISLTIFATLVYLAPTVLGARIRASVAVVVATAGIGLGPILGALGFALDLRPVATGGMAVALVGAIGQVAYVLDCYRRRGPFTSEHDWRAVAVGHLLLGPVWFAAAVGVALADLAAGRPMLGWSLGVLAVPMVGGWMMQELVGSWTHLVPSVTPGGPELHALQRRTLAFAARTRVAAWNAGVGAVWIGLWLGAAPLVLPGAALLAAAVALSVALLARSLADSLWRPDR